VNVSDGKVSPDSLYHTGWQHHADFFSQVAPTPANEISVSRVPITP